MFSIVILNMMGSNHFDDDVTKDTRCTKKTGESKTTPDQVPKPLST